MNVNQFTPEELAKLPKWALQKIEMLEAERRTAVDALRRYTDEQAESPFRITELECIGEQVGPTFITRYIQAHKMEIAWKGVELTVTTKDDGIFLSWVAENQSVRNFVGLVPLAFQQAMLRAEVIK